MHSFDERSGFFTLEVNPKNFPRFLGIVAMLGHFVGVDKKYIAGVNGESMVVSVKSSLPGVYVVQRKKREFGLLGRGKIVVAFCRPKSQGEKVAHFCLLYKIIDF